MEENFTTITYSNESLFIKQDNKISLREWVDNLLLLTNFESNTTANYSIDTGAQLLTSMSTLQNFNPFGFGKCLELSDSIAYNKNNFIGLTGSGSLSFRIRPKNNNAAGYQLFNKITPFTIAVNSTYQFEVLVGGVSDGVYEITLTTLDSTIAHILSKINSLIASNIGAVHESKFEAATGKIGIKSLSNGYSVEIVDVVGQPSFITFMEGVGTSYMLSPPSADVILAEFYNGTNNIDRIQIIHKTTTSNVVLRIYDKNQILIADQIITGWNNHSTIWNEFNISWDGNVIYFFLDGQIKKIILLDIWDKLTVWDARLQFNASVADVYYISEIVVYDNVYSFINYTPRTTPITKYFSSVSIKPYIEFNFGSGFKQNEVQDLNIVGSPVGLKFVVKNNNAWQYYVGGVWRNSDSSFVQANDPDILDLNFVSLPLNENTDLLFRVYFDSDGSQGVFIDNLNIARKLGSAEPAQLIGTIEINGTINLTNNKEITIKTKDGIRTIDLTTAVVDITQVTAQEVVSAINNANISDLAIAVLDPYNRIVLKTISTGESAILDVYEGVNSDAVPLVWGYANSDIGANEITNSVLNFTPLFDYVRRKLGAPIMPVELTEDQLNDCLFDSMAVYKRWRNFKVDMIYANLLGTPADGYAIPAIVGGEENIIEVVVRPQLPWSYYAGRDDLIGNMYVQSFFNRKGVMEGATDYYLTIQANNDLNILMNHQPKVSYMNRKIFVHPKPLATFSVAIRFKSPMAVDEIFNSDFIRRMMVANAKIVLGTIRSTFGGTIPGGEGMLQLNGESLKSEGAQELSVVVEEMKRSTEIYEFIFG